jgi:uncharacterized protein (DUF1015 family)
MSDIRPFRAWRPPREIAARVAAPPYDVLNTEEARSMARGNEFSYLHVNKPEIDFPSDFNPYDAAVYAKGSENLRAFIARGVLVQDPQDCLYLYKQRMGNHEQTGLVAGASVDEYERDLIKKHEFTRPDKEDDRTRHIDEMDANDEPVFLTYHADPTIDRHVAMIQARPPVYDFVTSDEIGHTLWVVSDPGEVETIRASFARIGALYVADGHHRSAAATRVCRRRREANPTHTGREAYNHFLAVIFPHNQMKIMPYNRVVRDLRGHSEEEFLSRVRERFECVPDDGPQPGRPAAYGMFLGTSWYRLRAREASIPVGDPVRSLDIAVLQDNLLNPVLGIEDPRRDKRIDFVGGIRGTAELERRVQRDGWAVAFSLYPVTMEQLMKVADAGQVMPPKSTWFEPKLRSGLFVRPLGDKLDRFCPGR